MENISIKKATLQEIAALQQIGRQTFSETFSETNTEENMAQYLDARFSIVQLTKELNNTDSHFYMALLGQKVIGYLKLNTGGAQTELQDNTALEIERIYVLAAHHGKNVGQLLYTRAVEAAVEMQSDYIWLGVWEENSKAIRFYQKNGFSVFDSHIFKLGDEEQTDLMMKKVMKAITPQF